MHRARARWSMRGFARGAGPGANVRAPSRGPLRSRGHGPGLQQVELSVFEGPFHIERLPEMPFELPADARELGELGVGKNAGAPLFCSERVLLDTAGGVGSNGEFLERNPGLFDRAVPTHHVVIRSRLA